MPRFSPEEIRRHAAKNLAEHKLKPLFTEEPAAASKLERLLRRRGALPDEGITTEDPRWRKAVSDWLHGGLETTGDRLQYSADNPGPPPRWDISPRSKTGYPETGQDAYWLAYELFGGQDTKNALAELGYKGPRKRVYPLPLPE